MPLGCRRRWRSPAPTNDGTPRSRSPPCGPGGSIVSPTRRSNRGSPGCGGARVSSASRAVGSSSTAPTTRPVPRPWSRPGGKSMAGRRPTVVFGAAANKELPDLVAPLAGLAAGFVLTKADSPRSAEPGELAEAAAAGPRIGVCPRRGGRPATRAGDRAAGAGGGLAVPRRRGGIAARWRTRGLRAERPVGVSLRRLTRLAPGRTLGFLNIVWNQQHHGRTQQSIHHAGAPRRYHRPVGDCWRRSPGRGGWATPERATLPPPPVRPPPTGGGCSGSARSPRSRILQWRTTRTASPSARRSSWGAGAAGERRVSDPGLPGAPVDGVRRAGGGDDHRGPRGGVRPCPPARATYRRRRYDRVSRASTVLLPQLGVGSASSLRTGWRFSEGLPHREGPPPGARHTISQAAVEGRVAAERARVEGLLGRSPGGWGAWDAEAKLARMEWVEAAREAGGALRSAGQFYFEPVVEMGYSKPAAYGRDAPSVQLLLDLDRQLGQGRCPPDRRPVPQARRAHFPLCDRSLDMARERGVAAPRRLQLLDTLWAAGVDAVDILPWLEELPAGALPFYDCGRPTSCERFDHTRGGRVG